MAIPKLFRKICSEASRCASEYDMLHEGDRVLVGLSGGEDSFMLMHVLDHLRRRAPFHFELFPANIDLSFQTFDSRRLQDYCRSQGWELHSLCLDGQAIIEEKELGHQPCPLCSRLRRGQLHRLADELSCNVLALGHHLDDVCVSFLMSTMRGGGLKTMAPNVPADGASKRLIRPLCTITKSMIHQAAGEFDFPILKSCPYEEMLATQGDRAFFEGLLRDLSQRIPDIRQNMLHSLNDVHIRHLFDRKYYEDYSSKISLPSEKS